MFTDTHAHIFKEYYDDIGKVIEDAESNGVTKIIIAATNIKECNEVISTSNQYENVYYCLGIHPDSINDDINELENIIRENIDDSKLVAIGEIGLDYHYGKEEKEKQIAYFDQQLSLAEEYNLPVVIHSRDATLDTIEVLKKHHVRGVMHCFSGSLETANILMKMGLYIGVGGVMTFKNSKVDEIIKEIPLDKIVLETDSPYLTPEPFRKYKNEPKYIKTIAEYLSELKSIPLNDVSVVINKNVKEIFDI